MMEGETATQQLGNARQKVSPKARECLMVDSIPAQCGTVYMRWVTSTASQAQEGANLQAVKRKPKGPSLEQNDQAHNEEEDDYEHSKEQRSQNSVHIVGVGAVCVLLCLRRKPTSSRGGRHKGTVTACSIQQPVSELPRPWCRTLFTFLKVMSAQTT